MRKINYKGSNGKEYSWRVWAEGSEVFTEYGTVDGLKQISSFVCEPKNIGKSNETTAEEQAELEAEALYIHRKERKEAIIKPMLAKNLEDYVEKLEFPLYIERKYDGVRCLAINKDGEWKLISRSGLELNIPHILAQVQGLNPDLVYDGEIYIHGTPFQRINQLITKIVPESSKLEYYIYDCVNLSNLDEPFAFREKRIHSIRIQSYLINSMDEAINLKEQFEEEGYEGAMIRTPNGVYKFGRSKDLLKFKSFNDDEFKIVGYKTGKGRFSNCPIWLCQISDKTFEATPVGSFEERAKMLEDATSYIGKMMKVKYFGLTKDGIPRFPIALGIREKFDI